MQPIKVHTLIFVDMTFTGMETLQVREKKRILSPNITHESPPLRYKCPSTYRCLFG